MPCANSLRCRLLAAGVLLLGVLSSAGCVPGVAWLPDSSGFYYTSGTEHTRLNLYDAASNKSKVVVKDTGAGTLWPAVSPDGEQIAVAKLIHTVGSKQTKLQVVLFSRAGKELSRSKEVDWQELKDPAVADRKQNGGEKPQLYWAPKEDKVLVFAEGGEGGHAAIYDVKADRMIHSWEGQLLVFGGSPLRPDGSGFLLIKNTRWPNWWDKKPGEISSDPGFTFVDWDGKETALKAPAYFSDADALKKEKDAMKLGALFWPAYFESGWDGDVAQVSWNVDRLRYLTDKGEVVLDKVLPEKPKYGGLVQRQYQFPGDQGRVRLTDPNYDTDKNEPGPVLRLEVFEPGQKEPAATVDGLIKLTVLIPAPNGKLMAAWITTKGEKNKGKEQVQILVINNQGEIVNRLPVDE
jgi:hypothetical protein